MIAAQKLGIQESRPAGRTAGRMRYTQDGDEGLEQLLAQACARAVSGLRGLVPARKLEAVMLGGGYGRGEGGVLRTERGDRPYNDLEFYVAIRGSRLCNELLYRRPIETLARILTQLTGIEVEFKITSLAELATQSPSMFTYDLVAGHRMAWGEPRALRHCVAHGRSERLPLGEGSRLLMNRGSGMLLARGRLARAKFTETDADFVRRNLAKMQLAIGDAVLTGAHQYHWSCRERQRRLLRLHGIDAPRLDEVRRHHAAGVEFKLHPISGGASREELAELERELTDLSREVWLWLESRRFGKRFVSIRAYAAEPRAFFPSSRRARNALLNLRAGGLGFLLRRSDRFWRHPRERAYRTLALLLWEDDVASSPTALRRLQAELSHPNADYPELREAYFTLWRRVQ